MNQFIGQTLGSHYRVTSVLGQQSGRRTLLAENTQTQMLVVIKLVLFGLDFTWEDLKLFEREAETLKSLDHPAIPKYLDSFEIDTPSGRGFALVQTYIEASSLKDWVLARRKFSEATLQTIARDLLAILHYLHSACPTVIHRDIKPSNILLREGSEQTPDQLYLIDFGSVQTAPQDGTITVVGTYGYMPPEQFGGRAQPASDLYSMGATLIYLATGKHPAELIQDDLTLAFARQAHLSEAFTQWLIQLTEPDLRKRIASVEDARQQLIHPQPRAPVAETVHGQSALNRLPHSKSLVESDRADFHIHATPEILEIQCSRSRIREPLRAKETTARMVENSHSPFPPLMCILTFWGFPYAIEFLSGVIHEAYLVVLFWLTVVSFLLIPIYWLPRPAYDKEKNVKLIFSRDRNNIFVSLETLLNIEKKSESEARQSHCETIPVDKMTVKASRWSKSYLKFTTFSGFHFSKLTRTRVYSTNGTLTAYLFPSSRLRIVGTRTEIRWLAGHIAQWQNMR